MKTSNTGCDSSQNSETLSEEEAARGKWSTTDPWIRCVELAKAAEVTLPDVQDAGPPMRDWLYPFEIPKFMLRHQGWSVDINDHQVRQVLLVLFGYRVGCRREVPLRQSIANENLLNLPLRSRGVGRNRTSGITHS